MSDWDKASDEALKILGKGSKLPDVPKAFETSFETIVERVLTRFIPECALCGKMAEDLGNDSLAFAKAVEQFRGRVGKDNLGLDAWMDAKKIQQARKVLTDALDDVIKKLKDNAKGFDKLQKQMEQIKPPQYIARELF